MGCAEGPANRRQVSKNLLRALVSHDSSKCEAQKSVLLLGPEMDYLVQHGCF